MTSMPTKEPLTRFILSIRDVGVAVTIFCVSVALTIDFTPRPVNPMDTPNLSYAAGALFMATAYLACRTIWQAPLVGIAITALYGIIVAGACLWHMVLTSGDINYLPTMEPISEIWLLFFGWVFFAGENLPPGDAQQLAQFMAYIVFHLCSAIAWGCAGYTLARCTFSADGAT